MRNKMTNRSSETAYATNVALTIRPMEEADFPRLLDMIHALEKVTEDQLHLDENALIDLLHSPSPWARILVADSHGSLVGYTALVGGLQLVDADRSMVMHHLYVLPECRGLRIGRALTDAARSLAQNLGCGTLTVGISRTSKRAKAAYRAFGFERRALRAPRYVMAV